MNLATDYCEMKQHKSYNPFQYALLSMTHHVTEAKLTLCQKSGH